jgi:alpha-1,2-mannosyltransferase
MSSPSGRRALAFGAPFTRARDWFVSRRLAFEIPLLGVLPVCFLAWLLLDVVRQEYLGFDFRFAFYPAAEEIAAGRSPFPGPGDPAIANEYAYVYPPLVALLLVPFTALSVAVASVVAIALVCAALFATLWILDVRDWRCYGVICAWAPTYDAIWTASLSIVLALAVALAWRYRAHVAGAAAIGLACSLKLFLIPLLAWPLARGRPRIALIGAAAACALILVPWAVIGFADIWWYPRLLEQVSSFEQTESYSLLSAFAATGLPLEVARGCSLVVAAALLGACGVTGRRGEELRSLTFGILSALALSPIAWQHYWVLLLVPLALVSPRFSPLWLAPIVLWIGLFERTSPGVRAASVAMAALVAAALVLHPKAARKQAHDQHDGVVGTRSTAPPSGRLQGIG